MQPGDLPRIESTPPAAHEALGMIPGLPARDWFALRWDPRGDIDHRGDELAREDGDGVALRAHPDVLVVAEPVVRRIAGAWRSAVPRELTWAVLDTAANVAIEGWHVMLGADSRAKRRGADRGE